MGLSQGIFAVKLRHFDGSFLLLYFLNKGYRSTGDDQGNDGGDDTTRCAADKKAGEKGTFVRGVEHIVLPITFFQEPIHQAVPSRCEELVP